MRYLLVFVRNMMCKWSLICHCLVQVVYLEVCATFPSSCSWMSLEGPEWVAARCIGSIIAIEFVTSKMESFKVRHRKVFATKSNPSIRNSQTRFKKQRSLCHQEVMEQGSYGKIWLNSCLSKRAVADVNFRNAPNQAASCCCPFPSFPWVRLCVFLKEMFRVCGNCAAVQKFWN